MFIVVENTPGYLSESDPAGEYETRDEAIDATRKIVAELCEAIIERGYSYNIDGSPESGYVVVYDCGTVADDLGRAVSIEQAS